MLLLWLRRQHLLLLLLHSAPSPALLLLSWRVCGRRRSAQQG
jgi:hypothetical protein